VEQELIHELAAAYALDALDPSERRAFEEHLAGCEQCREELEGLRDAAAALAYVPEGPAPPPALRDRVLERVRAEGPSNVVPLGRRRWVLPVATTVAVAATAAAIVLALWGSSLSNSLDSKNAALSILGDPAARRLPLGTSSKAVVLPDGRAAVTSTLARAPSGKTYELWVIDNGGAKPAGLFPGGRSNPVVLARRVPRGAQIGLSLERAGGRSDHPTIVLSVSSAV
jgi:anti-sigma-K factor RskA